MICIIDNQVLPIVCHRALDARKELTLADSVAEYLQVATAPTSAVGVTCRMLANSIATLLNAYHIYEFVQAMYQRCLCVRAAIHCRYKIWVAKRTAVHICNSGCVIYHRSCPKTNNYFYILYAK